MKNPTFCYIVLVIAQAAGAQSASTHEETYVRTAYAKLSYATEVGVISSFALDEFGSGKAADPKVVASQLRLKVATFDLSDFSSGNISDLERVEWRKLVTPLDANSRVLNVTVGSHSFKDNDLPNVSWSYATADWDYPPSHVNLPEYQEATNLLFGQLMAKGSRQLTFPDVVYSRYAAFTVTAHFGGLTSGPYRAMFLFGQNAKKAEVVAPEDPVVGATALFQASSQSLYPAGLLRSRLRQTPSAATWFNFVATSLAPLGGRSTGNLSCATSESGVRCGVSSFDLQDELSTPLTVAPSIVPTLAK